MAIHLSVVMPVYNERYLVAESIARVLAVESSLITRVDLIVVEGLSGRYDTVVCLTNAVRWCGPRSAS